MTHKLVFNFKEGVAIIFIYVYIISANVSFPFKLKKGATFLHAKCVLPIIQPPTLHHT